MKANQEQLWRKLDTQTIAAPIALPASAVVNAPVDEKSTQLAAELGKLSQMLADLKQDNERLRQTVSALTPAPVQVTPPIQAPAVISAVPSQAAPTAPPPAAPPPKPQQAALAAPVPPPLAPQVATPTRRPLELPAADMPTPQPPAGYADSSVYLQAPGLDLPISWRVFIPAM